MTNKLNLNWQRFWLSSLIALVIIFVFEMVWHGTFLMPIYNLTPDLWRSLADMQAQWGWTLARQVVTALLVAFIFTRNYEGRGVMEGVRYGLLVGLLLGFMSLGSYAWMPISLQLAWLWLAGDLVLYVLVGIALAWTYRQPQTA